MAFKTADTNKNEQQGEKIAYTVEVTRVTLTENEHRVLFDAKVNGVSISGFGFCEYTNQQGEQGTMVQFPQRKGKDSTGAAKYYNIVWFPVSRELKADIEKQICKFIDEMS
ncbi:MAG: hypothetical protein J6R22_03390 [Alphaproteobacteria bacterium]|jgi:DNA-binding cell septation regulator SpoVG|nr:hypothetical protein [Alphaproteobacteria bacterium]